MTKSTTAPTCSRAHGSAPAASGPMPSGIAKESPGGTRWRSMSIRYWPPRDLRMDQRVLPAETPHRESGAPRTPRRRPRYGSAAAPSAASARTRAATPAGAKTAARHRPAGPRQRRRRSTWSPMLVSDQHGPRGGERLGGFGERPGSKTRTLPSFLSRTQAWVNLVSFIGQPRVRAAPGVHDPRLVILELASSHYRSDSEVSPAMSQGAPADGSRTPAPAPAGGARSSALPSSALRSAPPWTNWPTS